jgi:hypothetical protein
MAAKDQLPDTEHAETAGTSRILVSQILRNSRTGARSQPEAVSV